MLDRLFRTTETEDHTGGRLTLRERYEDWRFHRDTVAIMTAFYRLSDRRLAMIGMHRSTLFESVADLMLEADRQRELVQEVTALLEKPTDVRSGDVHSEDVINVDEPTRVSKAA